MTERSVYLEDIPLDGARARLEMALREAGRWQPLAGVSVPLHDALGRVTAEPVFARLSSPHYHAAAMDGYAVRAEQTINATETRPLLLTIGEQVLPVNTGDPLPPETNAVIMVEDVQQPDDDQIQIRAPVAPWQHVRAMGEDIVATEMVLPANHKLRAVDLGALAACGHDSVMVRRQPRVTIIPTGNELVPIGVWPRPGQIIEYNSLVLRAQVIEAGGEANCAPIMPDDLSRLRIAISEAVSNQSDLVLVLSGSSAGSKDFTAAVIREMGELLVHGVAVRPGHPVILGMIERVPIIGVPGYPVSAALTGELFAQPLLAQWLGLPPPDEMRPRVQAVLTRKVHSPIGDDDYVRVTVAQIGERLLATSLNRGAGVITSLVRADGLALIPRFTEGVDAGQPIEVLLYRSLESIQKTVFALGSHDTMIDMLGQHLSSRLPGYRLTSAHVGSMGGLVGLRHKEAHLAGSHLLDPQSGDYNISYIQQYCPDVPVQVVTFAHREQGLIIARGNPLTIRSLDDLPRVRYVNRQRGAGTRVLLDYELAKRGVNPASVDGYSREEYTHLAVAAAIASGTADCGLGVRSGAIAMNLDFVSVGWERYDLVIPIEHLNHPGIQAILEILQTAEFQQVLAAQSGYDSRETGKVQYQS
jgi:putative molybdopterin biosynthesis protein